MAAPTTANAPNGHTVVKTADYYDAIVMVQNTVYPAGKGFINSTAAAIAAVTVITAGGNAVVFASIPAGVVIPLAISSQDNASTGIILLY